MKLLHWIIFLFCALFWGQRYLFSPTGFYKSRALEQEILQEQGRIKRLASKQTKLESELHRWHINPEFMREKVARVTLDYKAPGEILVV